jgi:hypothetical protein
MFVSDEAKAYRPLVSRAAATNPLAGSNSCAKLVTTEHLNAANANQPGRHVNRSPDLLTGQRNAG